MQKSFINKYLMRNLFPFCFRLRPAVSWSVMLERKQTESTRHKPDTGLGLSCFIAMACVFVSVIPPGVTKYVF